MHIDRHKGTAQCFATHILNMLFKRLYPLIKVVAASQNLKVFLH